MTRSRETLIETLAGDSPPLARSGRRVPLESLLWFLVAAALTGVLVVALLMAIYPAWKASRLNPTDALRHT